MSSIVTGLKILKFPDLKRELNFSKIKRNEKKETTYNMSKTLLKYG
jgi:hypothetical protein